MADTTLWDDVLGRIELKVNKHSFYTWFKPTSFISQRGQELLVRVPNPVFRDWLTKHYAGVIDGGTVRPRPWRVDRGVRGGGEARRAPICYRRSPLMNFREQASESVACP